MTSTQLHDVTVSDVTDRLDMPSGSMTQTSAGLSTGMIERWIKTGASILNTVVMAQGVDPAELTSQERELVRAGIIAYAEEKALVSRGQDDQKIDRARQEFQDIKRTIREMPSQTMPETDDASNRIAYSESDHDPKWSSDDFGGW